MNQESNQSNSSLGLKVEELFGIDLRSLAFFRISISLLVICDLIVRAFDLRTHYTDFGVLPRHILIEKFTNAWFLSVHFLNGTLLFQALLFFIAFLFAFLMLIGYKTRFVTFISWFLLMSLQVRNPFLLAGADIFLRMLLFWSMFLPLGALYSIDSALNTSKENLPKRIVSMATISIFVQVVFVYWFTTVLKSGLEWREEYSAVYYALSIDELATPIAHVLLCFPELLKFLTCAVYWFELIGPAMLFLPVFTGPIRIILITGFILLHIGFGSCLELAIFPWVSSIAMIPFIPSWFWDKIAIKIFPDKKINLKIYYDSDNDYCKKKALIINTLFFLYDKPEILPASIEPPIHAELKESSSWILVVDNEGKHYLKADALNKLMYESTLFKPFHIIFKFTFMKNLVNAICYEIPFSKAFWSKLFASLEYKSITVNYSVWTNLFIALCLIYIFFWNLSTLKPNYQIPNTFKPLGLILRLDQNWGMFAPYPSKDDGWYVIPGQLKDGTEIDLFNDNKPVTWEKPQLISRMYKNHHWYKHMVNLRSKNSEDHLRHYGGYLCRNWNSSHKDQKQLETLSIYFMREVTLPDYKYSKPQRVLLWRHWCFKVPDNIKNKK